VTIRNDIECTIDPALKVDTLTFDALQIEAIAAGCVVHLENKHEIMHIQTGCLRSRSERRVDKEYWYEYSHLLDSFSFVPS
jgi:hypothetical protein